LLGGDSCYVIISFFAVNQFYEIPLIILFLWDAWEFVCAFGLLIELHKILH